MTLFCIVSVFLAESYETTNRFYQTLNIEHSDLSYWYSKLFKCNSYHWHRQHK